MEDNKDFPEIIFAQEKVGSNGISCLDYKNYEDIEKGIMHYNQNDLMSLYVIKEDIVYNLLFMNSEEAYDKWVYASNKMLELIKDPFEKTRILNRTYRLEVFNKFREEYQTPKILGIFNHRKR